MNIDQVRLDLEKEVELLNEYVEYTEDEVKELDSLIKSWGLNNE